MFNFKLVSVSIPHCMKSNWIESKKLFCLKVPGKGHQPDPLFLKPPTASSECQVQSQEKCDKEMGLEFQREVSEDKWM